MIIDAFWLFTGGATAPGSNDGRTDAPTTNAQVSSNVIDIGLTGLPASSAGGGARDLGIGDDPALKILVEVTTGFTTSANTLQISLQGAPDNGSGAAGSYTTYVSGPAVAGSSMTGTGVRLLEIDFPRTTVPSVPAPPRFLQLLYTLSGALATGKIVGTAVLDRHDQIMQANATLGGYPAGVTVAN